MAQAALKYANNLDYAGAVSGAAFGSASAAGAVRTAGEGRLDDPRLTPSAIPVARPRPRAEEVRRHRYGISLFAITGAFFVCALMIFVILAYISFNEVSVETVRLQERLAELREEERKLEIAYERTFDLKEVELYATRVLGMSKPDSDQISVLESAPADKAVIITDDGEEGTIGGLGSFLSSLLAYFK